MKVSSTVMLIGKYFSRYRQLKTRGWISAFFPHLSTAKTRDGFENQDTVYSKHSNDTSNFSTHGDEISCFATVIVFHNKTEENMLAITHK